MVTADYFAWTGGQAGKKGTDEAWHIALLQRRDLHNRNNPHSQRNEYRSARKHMGEDPPGGAFDQRFECCCGHIARTCVSTAHHLSTTIQRRA
jgi:hypothetical protein